jgi:Na+/H+-dicarboxylate symporter
MTFSRKILAGLALGILTGLFFGEKASALKWAADGFVKLLQMMVLPYITVSIIASLGSLQPSELRTLGVRAAAVIGGLWVLALAFAFLISLTFPSVQNASFFSSSLVEPRPAFNFIDLYIPSNPFNSLANNVVPAVVLFSLILGVAVVGVPRRERLLDVLLVARDAISAATRFVARLTPYGLFAIAANAAGTLGQEQLGRLQIYLVAYVAIALLVSLWVLPGLVAALTPIRLRDVLGESHDSLITAFIAGDLFIVLPGLMQASRTLLGRLSPGNPEPGRLTEVIVPASFNFPHTGKLLSLSFILFAGWFADAPVPFANYPQLALTGLVTFFGSQCGGAVSPRPVSSSHRYVSVVSGHRRRELSRRVARRRGQHAGRCPSRLVCGDGPPPPASRSPALVRADHRHARCRRHRRHARTVRERDVGVLEGQSPGVDVSVAAAGRGDGGTQHIATDRSCTRPIATRRHQRTQGPTRVLPTGRNAVRLLQRARRSRGLRRRARAPLGARARRQSDVRAG